MGDRSRWAEIARLNGITAENPHRVGQCLEAAGTVAAGPEEWNHDPYASASMAGWVAEDRLTRIGLITWPDGTSSVREDRCCDQCSTRFMTKSGMLGATDNRGCDEPSRDGGDGQTGRSGSADGRSGCCSVLHSMTAGRWKLAQDEYWRLEDNIRSLALAVEGMRRVKRHGGHRMAARAFDDLSLLSLNPDTAAGPGGMSLGWTDERIA